MRMVILKINNSRRKKRGGYLNEKILEEKWFLYNLCVANVRDICMFQFCRLFFPLPCYNNLKVEIRRRFANRLPFCFPRQLI